jgi:DNA-binding LacI/PurR family transcriptional regulator
MAKTATVKKPGVVTFVPPVRATEAKRRLLKSASGWAVGTRLPPIPALARQLGIGQRSVHAAVQELVSDGVLMSRQRVGTYLARPLSESEVDNEQVATSAARPAALTRINKNISLCIDAGTDEIILEMTRGFESVLLEHGAQVTRGTYDGQNPDFSAYTKSDAVVVFNPNSHPDLRCRGGQLLAVVHTAANVGVAMAGGYDVVSVDQEQGGFLAGDFLRRAGCRSACFLGGTLFESNRPVVYDPTSSARLAGFQRGWGAPLPEETRLAAGAYTEGRGARAAAEFVKMARRPEAVFAASDDLALGFIKGALAHGLEPGHDYHIVGFDGQKRGQVLAEGPLTTVAVPAFEMGRRGAQLLIERFAVPEQPVRRLHLGCHLLEGKTAKLPERGGKP